MAGLSMDSHKCVKCTCMYNIRYMYVYASKHILFGQSLSTHWYVHYIMLFLHKVFNLLPANSNAMERFRSVLFYIMTLLPTTPLRTSCQLWQPWPAVRVVTLGDGSRPQASHATSVWWPRPASCPHRSYSVWPPYSDSCSCFVRTTTLKCRFATLQYQISSNCNYYI